MSKFLKKSILTFFACILMVSACQISEAVALIDHKEIKKSDMQVLIPRIKKGADTEVLNKVNALLDKKVTDSMKDYQDLVKDISGQNLGEGIKNRAFYSSYAVKINKNDLFSINLDGYQYTGGAHGIRWRTSITTDLRTGKVLSLGDLFKPGSNYQEVLGQKIRAQITRYGEGASAVDFKGVSDNTNFYITEEVLVIYYQPYEIAPYVYGLPEFLIAIEDIEDLLNDEISIMIQKP